MDKTLYIFIDESGNFDFSPKGSTYFILTSISTLNPLSNRDKILGAKYDLLSSGFEQEHFHATEDKQVVRDKMFSIIKTFHDIDVDSVIAQKNKANTVLYQPSVEEKFYKQLCETLLQYVAKRYLDFRSLDINKVIVVLDNLFTGTKRAYVTKHIKSYFKANYGIVPYVYFHQIKSDPNCQIADYCCWAIKKKWKNQDLRPYNEIQSLVKSEFPIFARGKKTYY